MEKSKEKMDKIVVFFGICDWLRLALYFISKLKAMKLPFLSDVINSIKLGSEEGHPIAYLFGFTGLSLFVSLIFSGYFLIRRKTIGAWLVYFQFPLRLFLVTPSIPFILWTMKKFTSNLFPLVMTFVILLEVFKLVVVIMWHKRK